MCNMQMLNGDVVSLYQFIMERKMSVAKSRLRMRFCKILQEKYNELIEEAKICKTQADLELLNNEKFILDNTQERKEMLLLIKEIIEQTDETQLELDGAGHLLYDRICEIPKTIHYEE